MDVEWQFTNLRPRATFSSETFTIEQKPDHPNIVVFAESVEL
ncbi:unnamed protein product [Schistosoma mattheei]|uniref:Uncharacterized protein n=1 Tax=Schistosoma mattheei TaxID=31246 RepID=A0A183P5U4_9TREM|nr:unnamed protein product [Schistosoma mattheei]